MKIIVTGGAGFIGSHLVDLLIAQGHEVYIIDNLSSGKRENVNPKSELIVADIRDDGTAGIVREISPDAVFHEAAQVSVRESVADPAADAEINIIGSIRLIKAAADCGVGKFVFASSGGAIYGDQESFPAPETHPTRPVSPYGIAKLSVEHYLYYFNREYGLGYAALRYSNVYGPRQDPYGEAGVVAIFSNMMLKGEEPRVNGDGGQTRDYVYVGDVVRANLLALGAGVSGCYNVGTGIETSVNELYGRLKTVSGYAGDKVHGPAKPGEQYRSVIDAGLLGRETGWSPKVSLDKGLAETVDYFRKSAGAGRQE